MKTELYLAVAAVCCFDLTDGNNDAYIPEVWANESLMLLEENMVAANLVHRSFEEEIKDFGDTVNTRRPQEFKTRRKTDTSNYKVQDAKSDNVQVKLDQWFEVSFKIPDASASMAFQDLSRVYLLPAAQQLARSVDRAVLGRMAHGFWSRTAGRLKSLTKSNASDYVLDAREQLNLLRAPEEMRRLILAPRSETPMQKTELFVAANKRGDGGTALENAHLGRIHGFDTFLAQNVASLLGGQTIAGVVNSDAQVAGYDEDIDVTITSYEVVNGEFAVIAGDDQPTWIKASTSSTNTTSITLNQALKHAIAGDAVVTVYQACVVDGDHAAGHSEAVIVDGFTTAPQIGQLIAFGTGANRRTYTIIESEDGPNSGEQALYLDRPLELALTNDDPAFPGPAGDFNPAFHPNSFALVSRPLATPPSQHGVQSGVASYNGLSMRVSFQYDINAGATRVNMDMLAGTAILDDRMGVIMLG